MLVKTISRKQWVQSFEIGEPQSLSTAIWKCYIPAPLQKLFVKCHAYIKEGSA